MAETFLSPVIVKLIDLLFEEAESLKDVHKHVKSLQKELEIIEPLLRDAEAKSTRAELGEASKVWLRQLREEAENIEDIIDKYTYYAEKQRQDQESFYGSIRKAGKTFKTLKTRHDLASEIRDVKESLREIKERGTGYGLRPFEQGLISSCVVDPRIGSLFLNDNELVGVESLSMELVASLMEGSLECTVVSLVGQGGIGKTTLARKVYNDVVEKGYFDIHVWVTVSQSYDTDKVLKMLMTRICPSGGETTSLEEAFTLLRSSMLEKRYVIVFDDVWETDFWSVIKHAFPSTVSGSRIILTTRKSSVVESFKSPSSCEMIVKELKSWSIDKTWKLFCKKTFQNSCCPPELDKLSREIIKKCQGLPLAVVAISGLLSKKEKLEVEWQKALDNLNYEFEENRELSSVSKVLLLSYDDLPHRLKLCFLYFGIFPEDFAISGERLCKIWIAEGFIEWRKDKTLEQIAKEYLIELTSRNLVSFELLLGTNRLCKVHDLIREVIQKRANDLCFYQVFDQNKSISDKKGRRLVIHYTTQNVIKSFCDSKIRSIVLVNANELSTSFVVGLFQNCKLLKVVDFEYALLGKLPKEVGNLLHLKYLNLRGTKVKSIPKSIGKLRNLQTLDVSYTLVRELPIEINKLKKLRHLLAMDFDEESEYSVQSYIGVRLHEGIGRLEELQSLKSVEAQSGKVDFFEELQRLSKLKHLGITKVCTKTSEALGKCIEKMNELEELFLYSINEEEVLDFECIRSPPLPLRYFKLSSRLQRLPTWVSELHCMQGLHLAFSRLVETPMKCLENLPNLTYLRLYQAYDGEELLFKAGCFPKLKQLELRRLERLKVVKIEREALPFLEELVIGPFPLMKEMPDNLHYLSSLKFLRICDMPREFVNALQPGKGSEYLKIQHISTVTFSYYTGKGSHSSSELLQHLEVEQDRETAQN